MRFKPLFAGALCLLSSSISVVVAQNAADYFVHSLPGAPEGPLLKMHAGHIEVKPDVHGHLFFWHFQNRHIANKQRTVIWLNGGPGCSSMDGALMEIGPYRVREGGNLEYNNGSWDEFANVLFVDNPTGTGYSYVDVGKYVTELEEMADEMVTFLTKWFQLFPEYETDDLYISGESYAGQHIPYIAKAILERNKRFPTAPWALKGLLIGNGWISPEDQYPAYLQYAYKSGLIESGSQTADQLERSLAVCKTFLGDHGDDRVDNPNCEGILNQLLQLTQDTTKSADSMERCINMYDIRLRDRYSSCGMNWPPDLKDVTPYLRRDEVKRALNVDPNKSTGWAECNGNVGNALRQTKAPASVRLLPSLLESVPIVLFSGEKDLICNHIGTEEMINRMSWNGGTGFEISPGVWAPRQKWTFEDQPAGIYQKARNLTYILFYNSSHMVPFDYPRRTRDMLDRFMDVDIGSIGGTPANSRLDGEKGMETSVGGHPNSTVAEKEEHDRIEAAAWHAYYKSGETALVVVIILAAVFFYWVWRGRRRQGYDPLREAREGLENYRHNKDEESGEFNDEAEMRNLGGQSGDRFSLSSDGSNEPYSPAGKISNGYGKHQ